jgi:VCBS repeat-containing protein
VALCALGALAAAPSGPARAQSLFPPTFELAGLAAGDGGDGFVLNGIAGGDFSGWSVAGAGDVNGDGVDDLIIGAWGADSNVNSYINNDSGESYVVFGQSDQGDGFPASLDLSALNGTNGFVLNGIDGSVSFRGGDRSGRSVAGAGDVNGDGVDDLIIGAPYADATGRSDAGESYVVFGQSDGFPASLELSALDGDNGFVLNGIDDTNYSGWSVAGAGDVNGDGVDDPIIGATGATGGGASYVVFGQSTGFPASLELSALDGTNGFVLNGIAGDESGRSVAGAGDVNGDGFDDLIIGARRANPNGNFDSDEAGESYVVFGRSDGFSASLELSALDGTDGFVLNGIDEEDFSGDSVAGAGDVNGDGVDDLIIGAPDADPNVYDDAGESYVVFGQSDGFSASLELSALDGTNGFVLNGIDIFHSSGGSVAGAGDVNGDGVDDLIIAAVGADPNGESSGESYVVFGQSDGFPASLELSGLDGTNGFVLNGIDVDDYSGGSVAGGWDVNGDGFDDVIIGATGGDPNGIDEAGESYVVFGRSTAPSNQPPVAQDDALTTDEATPISANLFADNGAGPDTDPEGETLTVDAVNGDSAAVNTTLSLDSGALLTVSGEGTLDYDPNGAFDTLGAGETAEETFTYRVTDGTRAAEANVTLTIEGLDDDGTDDGTGDGTGDGTEPGDTSQDDDDGGGGGIGLAGVLGAMLALFARRRFRPSRGPAVRRG